MSVSNENLKNMIEGMTADLVRMLMEKKHFSMPQSFDLVYNSQTYEKLRNPATQLFYQSPGYVYELLEEEIADSHPQERTKGFQEGQENIEKGAGK